MNPDLALALDASGTLVFALSGGFLAIRKDLDIFGIVVLSVAAGLGGGMIRDVLLGATPPAAIENEFYVILAIGAALVTFTFHRYLRRLYQGIILLDALGLGFFAVAGTLKSLDFDVNLLPAVLLGVVSGVGGGVIRDVLGLEIPIVLRQEVYALAALLGAVSCAVIVELDGPTSVAAFVGVTSTVTLRMLAVKFGWNAPRPRDRPPPWEG